MISIFIFGFKNKDHSGHKFVNVRVKLKKQKNEIRHLKKRFLVLKNSLNINSKDFRKVQEKRERLDSSLSSLKIELDDNEIILRRKIRDVRKLFSSYILSELNNEQNLEFLLNKKDNHLKIKNKMHEINRDIDFNLSLKNEIKDLASKFNEYDKKQNDLISILVSLEKEKKEVSGKYKTILKRKGILKLKLSRLKSKKSIFFGKLKIPIKDYYKISLKSKGITFFYNKKGNLMSPEKGKIIHSGKLSSYGDVVIIDHGYKIKTVFLGNFSNTLKKGSSVNRGQIIGRLMTNLKKSTLYFEVRKMGKVQNTVGFLNGKNLKKKNETI